MSLFNFFVILYRLEIDLSEGVLRTACIEFERKYQRGLKDDHI